MAKFTNNISLITFISLMITLSGGYCKKNAITLNCTISYAPNHNTTFAFANPIKTPAINSCPEGYKNESIIEKCERLISRENRFDGDLITPVTNNVTGVTYWNKFCASCNNDTETKWTMWVKWYYHKDGESWCDNLRPRILRAEIDDIPELIKTLVQKGVKLVSTYYTDRRQLECLTDGNWPVHLLQDSLYCLLNDILIGQSTRLLPCQYTEKTGRICTTMRLYLQGLYYQFRNGKEIDYNISLSEFKFGSNEYMVETSYDGMNYICEQTATIYGLGHSGKIIISIISLIFIIAYLGINLNKRYFQNTANKMLYLYIMGLILIGSILLSAYLSYRVPCVTFQLAQLSWFYHFFWTLLILIEYIWRYHCKCDECKSDYNSTNDNSGTADDDSSRCKNYSFYVFSVLGLVIPLLLTITYYFGVLVINENYTEDISQISPLRNQLLVTEYTCPAIPDHSGVPCTPYRDSGSRRYASNVDVFLSSSFSFFIPASFVLITAFGVNYFTRCCSDNTGPIESTKRDHMIVLMKMGLIMGVHWVLYKIYVKFGDNYSSIFGLSLDTICQFSIDFHGVIVFLVFGIGNCMNKFGYEFKSVSQHDDTDAGKPPQSYALTAPSNQTQAN